MIISFFRQLSGFEKILWLSSVVIVALSFLLSPNHDILNLTASLIGVTALIFVAKGMVFGQILTVIFSLFYGFISLKFHYYGEMITYLGMTSPIAILSVISWIRHPYKESDEVEVSRISGRKLILLFAVTTAVTVIFYFILKSLGNANLLMSTFSVFTSFLASSLMMLRSPYYAVAYSANDIVLIVLWLYASMENMAYLPMAACFSVFFINDIYGFYNWKRMSKRQQE